MIFPTIVKYQHDVGLSTWFSWLDFGQPSTFYQSFLVLAMSLFGQEIVTYKFFVILSFVLSGLTTYFVALRLARFPLSALVSGIVYMNSQFLFSQFFEGHLDAMIGYSIFPLAIYFAYNLFSAPKIRVLFYGAFEVIFLLSSHLNIAYIGGVCILLTIIFSAAVHRRLGIKFLVKRIVLLLTVSISLSASFLIPYFGGAQPVYITYSSIPAEPTETITSWFYGSITGVSVENSFIYFWKNVSYSHPSSIAFSGVSLGGMLLFVGSCISIIWFRRRFSVWLFAALIISILLASGITTPFGVAFTFLWKYMPFFNTVRFLDRWLIIASLSEALLLAILVDGFHIKYSSPKSRVSRL
ncbi:MAG TPA: hypothetical protein VK209_01140, partial [Candidatus Sulfotelmatobacter sp.]|nr:hypothetical protein [Candidatus Sulfotelmatobacter sp.]